MGRPLFDESLAGVDPDFRENTRNLMAAVRTRGGELGIRSGFRSRAQQERLYADAQVKYADNPAYLRKRVARPGHSQHERGMAVDFSGSKNSLAMANELAGQFGLVRAPWSGADEAWHFEPVGARSVRQPMAAADSGAGTPSSGDGGPPSMLAPGPLPGPDTAQADPRFFLQGGANDPRVALFQAALAQRGTA